MNNMDNMDNMDNTVTDMHYVGQYVFTNIFNPYDPLYDANEVSQHFQDGSPDRIPEFIAWRNYFYQDAQIRCDMCLIRRLDCISVNEQTCTNCAESGLYCSITNDPNVPQLNPGYFPDGDPFAVIPDLPDLGQDVFQGQRMPMDAANPQTEPDAPVPNVSLDEVLGMLDNMTDDKFAAFDLGIPPNPTNLNPAGNVAADNDALGIPDLPAIPDFLDIPEISNDFRWDFSLSPSGQYNQPTVASTMPMNLLNQPMTASYTPAGNVPSPSALLDLPPSAPAADNDGDNKKRKRETEDEGDNNRKGGPSAGTTVPGLPPMPDLPDIPDFSLSPSGQHNHPTVASPSSLLPASTRPLNLLNQPMTASYTPAAQNPVVPQNQPAASSTSSSSASSSPPVHSYSPVPSYILPREASPGSHNPKRPRRSRCTLCRDSPPLSTRYKSCKWAASRVTNDHYGCVCCRQFGLVCVVDAVALPPNPTVNFLENRFRNCDPCRQAGTSCERQRPCQSCNDRGTPQLCVGPAAGTFRRGVGHGTELYGYLSLMRNTPGLNRSYTQPHDYHVQYVRWLLGGPVPTPPGYQGPVMNPQRPDISLRILALPLPAQLIHSALAPVPPVTANPISNVSLSVNACVECNRFHRRCGRQIPTCSRCSTRGLLCVYPNQAPPPGQPALLQPPQPLPVVQNPVVAAQGQSNANPVVIGTERRIVIPPGVDQNEIDRLGQGITTIIRIAQFLRAQPVPGPTLLLYDTNGIQPYTNAHLNAALNDPERAAQELIQFPRPNHPYPGGEPALRTIPEVSLIDNNQPNGRCIEKVQGNICDRLTISVCEDTTHGPNCEFPVCVQCNTDTKARFEPAVTAIAKALRVYACGPCSALATDPANFEGKRLRVWGVKADDFANDVGPNKSIAMGDLPLRITGCNCATKLLNRSLCTGHRLEHFLQLRTQAQNMRRYITGVFGRHACPFCLNRVGADAYNFCDQQGTPLPNILYTCLGCFGVVTMTAGVHRIHSMFNTPIVGNDGQ